MTLNERHNAIMQVLKRDRTANVKELAGVLFVSEATVRRDLAEMKNLGLIERSHGGAILPENAEEISIFVRMNKNAKEKERVATNALARIPEFRSVFIDSSSTALALAERMDLTFKTVVTNNLQTAINLSKKQDVNLILLGGNVQFNTVAVSGTWTARQLEEFSFDLTLCSCASVVGSSCFERSLDQKEIKLSAFKRSKKKVLLVDHTKFETPATYRLADLSEFDLIVSDVTPPAPYRDLKNLIF